MRTSTCCSYTFPVSIDPTNRASRQRGHRQAFVVAAQECAGAGLDAGQERTDAEIAIHDPEIARLGPSAPPRPTGPASCACPSSLGEDIDRHLHRPGHRPPAPCQAAVPRRWCATPAGDAPSLQCSSHPGLSPDSPAATGDSPPARPRRCGGGGAPRVAHQRPGALGLHAVELVVHRRDGDRDLPPRPLRLIRGMTLPKALKTTTLISSNADENSSSRVYCFSVPRPRTQSLRRPRARRRVRAALAASPGSETSRRLGGKTHPVPWHPQSRPSREALSQTSLAIGGANVQRFLGLERRITPDAEAPPNAKRASRPCPSLAAAEAWLMTKSLYEYQLAP